MFKGFLSDICLYLGFGSIILSNLFWFNYSPEYLTQLHNEHQAIFVGLWVPSFFILSKIFKQH